MTKTPAMELVLKGIKASPGICIGKAYLVDKEGVEVVKKYNIPAKELGKEINRFKSAVKQTSDELHRIIEDSPEEFRQNANILETYILLLKDKMLYERTIETINDEHVNAEWALKKVVMGIRMMFLDMADEYFRERGNDIVHVSDRIMRNLVGEEQVNLGNINKRVILVAEDLSPAQTSQIQLEKIMGLITERGGRASHTGIIARTLEIPATLGLGQSIRVVRHDDIIIVDGNEGVVIVNPSDDTLIEYEERKFAYERYKAIIARGSYEAAETVDGHRLAVMGNIELPEEVVSVLDYGGDGIGLYRTEFQYMNRSEFPSEEELFDKYKDVVDVMAPRPVTIRTLDVNGDKAVSWEQWSREEINPALGLRAIRYCLKKPKIFKIQLRAILRVAAYGNVRILIPMISSLEEVIETKKLIMETADELEKEGITFSRTIQTGVMIEVPSAVIIADSLAREVDFFSIGTNDLIQYTLAIDRGNFEVAHMHQPLHPAIVKMVKHVSDVAAGHKIGLYMCGEMASDPIHVPLLLAMGIKELSMNPQCIPEVKRMIRSLSLEGTKDLLDKALTLNTTLEINNLMQDTYGKILSDIASLK